MATPTNPRPTAGRKYTPAPLTKITQKEFMKMTNKPSTKSTSSTSTGTKRVTPEMKAEAAFRAKKAAAIAAAAGTKIKVDARTKAIAGAMKPTGTKTAKLVNEANRASIGVRRATSVTNAARTRAVRVQRAK